MKNFWMFHAVWDNKIWKSVCKIWCDFWGSEYLEILRDDHVDPLNSRKDLRSREWLEEPDFVWPCLKLSSLYSRLRPFSYCLGDIRSLLIVSCCMTHFKFFLISKVTNCMILSEIWESMDLCCSKEVAQCSLSQLEYVYMCQDHIFRLNLVSLLLTNLPLFVFPPLLNLS